jgi:hypothetical protein
MTKLRFNKSEVISYLEEKLLMNEANQDETELYENYIWNNKLTKGYTYKKLIAEMKDIFEGNI